MSTTLTPQERDALLQQFEAMEAEAPLRWLTPGELKHLTGMASDAAPIVSAYLDLGPEARRDRTWATVLKNLARDVVTVDAREARQVADEVARIERTLSQRLPDLGRSLAVFASEPLGLWHEVMLPVALPNRLKHGRRPYLRPLFRVLDEHERFLIVLLDAQRARLFISQLGSIVEVADLIEEAPTPHREGGWVEVRVKRQRDAHVLWHAGAVAHATQLAMEHFGARWLLISGTPEVLVDFRQQLPQAITMRLGGDFRVQATATANEVAQAAVALQQLVEEREELATIERLGNARPGGRGVWGIEETLRTLNEMRVMTLVVQHDYRVPGGICIDSGQLTANTIGLCPHCGESVAPIDDVVELALERAHRQAAQLEMVRSRTALARLGAFAPIGAVLRY